MSESHFSLPPEFFEHYASGYEAQRLQSGSSQIELARTQELVMRYVPSPPTVIFDIGGGPGVYACWLAKQGYEVHLLDANPLHVELARQASQAQPDAPLASIEVGDARSLKRPDASVDVVLLFGPLYHLTERADRLTALQEAHRVLRLEVFYSQWASPVLPLRLMACARGCLTIPSLLGLSSATCWMGSIATRRTTRCISQPPFFIIQRNYSPKCRRLVSSMKGRCPSKDRYGFHLMWSQTSQTRSSANNFWHSHVGLKRNRLCSVSARICWPSHAKHELI